MMNLTSRDKYSEEKSDSKRVKTFKQFKEQLTPKEFEQDTPLQQTLKTGTPIRIQSTKDKQDAKRMWGALIKPAQ